MVGPARDRRAIVGPGTKLGPYEIVSPLGTGGMGEVYRAYDARLGRTVAIKVLSKQLSQSPDLKTRLNQEVHAISKLSHPNICGLHDIGHYEGTDFLVLEYLEGKTLRQVLASGTLPLRRAIQIAVQVAEGLAKGHDAGIIHRDLKPENLMISPEVVKILDFGLAKLRSPSDDAIAATTESAQSRAGAILGTLRYMSPEQATGQAIDFRSDQFSFGTMLYEMVTQRHPFLKATIQQTVSAIIQEEPRAIGSLNPEIPPPFCWLVERCMAKEPEKRYFSSHDLVLDLFAIHERLIDLQPRVLACIRVGRYKAQTFVVEREIPGAGNLTEAELRKICRKPSAVLSGMGPEMKWLQSYVTGDKVYCVYLAPDGVTIREHTKAGRLPAQRISTIRRLISPATAE